MRKHIFFQDKKDKNKKFYEADVVRVIDGDTIDVEHNFRTSRIRVKGIDAPESNQPFGWESHQYLLELIGNTTVYISTTDVDKYRREVSNVLDTEYNDISLNMIRNGLAWADFEDGKFDPKIKEIQDQAQKEKRGLWAEQNPIKPKTWRDHKMTMKDKEKEKLRNKKNEYLKENNISKSTNRVNPPKRAPILDMYTLRPRKNRP